MMFDAEKLGHDVVRFHNILPVSVCEEVVGAAESANDWVASRVVVDNDSSLASKQREQVGILSPSRNCEQVYFFRNPGLRQYESIILSLADKCLKWWDANICAVPPGYDYEPPYVVRYKVGQQFRAHTDIRRIRDGHIRLFTILFYLSESMGGDLWFPDYKITIPNVPALRPCSQAETPTFTLQTW